LDGYVGRWIGQVIDELDLEPEIRSAGREMVAHGRATGYGGAGEMVAGGEHMGDDDGGGDGDE
jgi:hypothetical protein